MQQSQGQYELVMNPEYEDFNLELLQDYWQFNEIEKHQFTYSVKKLVENMILVHLQNWKESLNTVDI